MVQSMRSYFIFKVSKLWKTRLRKDLEGSWKILTPDKFHEIRDMRLFVYVSLMQKKANILVRFSISLITDSLIIVCNNTVSFIMSIIGFIISYSY